MAGVGERDAAAASPSALPAATVAAASAAEVTGPRTAAPRERRQAHEHDAARQRAHEHRETTHDFLHASSGNFGAHGEPRASGPQDEFTWFAVALRWRRNIALRTQRQSTKGRHSTHRALLWHQRISRNLPAAAEAYGSADPHWDGASQSHGAEIASMRMGVYIYRTMARVDRTALLEEALKERVLCLDGATGTAIQARNLTAKDFGGDAFEGCNENLVPHAARRRRGHPPGHTSTPARTSSRPTRSGRRRSSWRSTRRSRRRRTRSRAARRRSPRSRAREVDAPTGRASWRARWGRRPRPSRSRAASPSRSSSTLLRPGEGARRRRRGLSPSRDLPGHAQHQSGDPGHRPGVRGGG